MDINFKSMQVCNDLSIDAELYIDKNNKKIYKIYRNKISIALAERNIRFLYNCSFCCPRILELLYEGDVFLGYSQEYIDDAHSFFDGINDTSLTFDKKFDYICDIFTTIKTIHGHNIYIGDVHSRNMIYDDSKGYLIDLDDIRFSKEDNYSLSEYYYVHRANSDNFMESSKITDNIKATVVVLSLLYGFDFEKILIINSLDVVMSYLELFTNDNNLLDDLRKIFYNDNEDDILYFDDVLKKYFSDKKLVK